MVQVTTQQVTTVTLTLSPEEAYWLKGVMQNPLHGHSPSEESAEENEMRLKFWNALGGDRPQPRPPFQPTHTS